MKKIICLITLLPLVFVSCSKNDEAPVSNFSFSGNENFAPCLVYFTNTSTNASSVEWDFGDGQKSTYTTPTHVFSKGGTYNVTLTTKNSTGTQNVLNKIITIKNAPTKVRINSITLTSMSFVTPTGGGWDLSDGPDLYFKMTDVNNAVNFFTATQQNILQSQLPLVSPLTTPFQTSSLTSKYTIELYDYDNGGTTDQWIGGFYFYFSDEMPTNGSLYPAIIYLSNSATTTLKFQLNVDWLP